MAFVVTLVFGFGVEVKRSLASLTRFFTSITQETLARSAFQKKFSTRSVAFLQAVFGEATKRAADRLGTKLGNKLRRLRDVCVLDASVIRLHDFLADRFSGCRTNHSPAAAKLQLVWSLAKGVATQLAVTAERVSDSAFAKRFQVVRGQLLLFDLGYYANAFFSRLHQGGAFFVSRLKDSANPTIVKVRRGIARGCKAKDKRLWDVTFADGRPVDLDVRLCKDGPIFRLVGTYNTDKNCWHLFVTNLPTQRFSVDEIALLYRVRWEIELLFKELKSTCRLDQVNSSRAEVVLSFFYASLLSLLTSRTFARTLEEQRAGQRIKLSYRIVTVYLTQHALFLAEALFRGPATFAARSKKLLDDIARTCRDPNPQRPSALGKLCR